MISNLIRKIFPDYKTKKELKEELNSIKNNQMKLVFNIDEYDTVLISCKQKIDYYDSDYIVSCIQKNIAKNISNLVLPYIEFEMVDDSIIGEYKYCSHPKTIKGILKVLKKKK